MQTTTLYEETFGDYTCKVVQNSFGVNQERENDNNNIFPTKWYCGYVTIPKSHPYADKSYDEVMELFKENNYVFPQELTFADTCKFGFDTAHYGDHSTLVEVIEQTKILMQILKACE